MNNTLKTYILLVGMTVLFIFIGGLIGGQNGMIIAFAIAMVMNFVSYWFSASIVLAMYKAKEVTEAEQPYLVQAVRRLSAKAGLPMPKVCIIPDGAPNAFATGRNPEHAVVAVTQGLLNLLNQEELEGVLAHELAHVKGRDILIGTIAAAIAGAVMILANMVKWGAILGSNRDSENGNNIFVALAIAIVAPIAAMIVQMAISRSMEYRADETAAQISGNPQALASALSKIARGVELDHNTDANPATAHMFIMNPLSAEGVMGLFSTHPAPEKRIERLLAMRRIGGR